MNIVTFLKTNWPTIATGALTAGVGYLANHFGWTSANVVNVLTAISAICTAVAHRLTSPNALPAATPQK